MATSKHETRFLLTADDKTKVAVKSAEAGFKKLDGVVGKLAAGFAGLAGVGGIGMLINSQVAAAREARSWADALGVPIEKLTAMQSASETVGIQSEKMADILKDTSEKIADAYRNGGGEAVEVLESLGINIAEINALSPDQQLFRIAEALGQVGTQGEKIQIMEALASDAALLLPLLDNNAEKLQRFMDRADATGRTLTGIEADKLLAAGEAIKGMEMASDALAQTLAVNLAPYLTNVIEFTVGIVDGFGKAEKKVQEFFDTLFAAGNDEAFTSLADSQERLNLLLRRYGSLRRRLDENENANEGPAQRRLDNLAEEIRLQRQRVEQAERQKQLMEDFRNGKPLAVEVSPDLSSGTDPMGDAEQQKLETSLERLRQSLLSEEDLLQESYTNKAFMVDDAFNAEIISFDERNQMLDQLHDEHEQKLTDISDREARKRVRIEDAVEKQKAALKQRGLSMAVGLMRTLGQEHDGFAYAAIALEKAIALAQIETSTAAALAGANTLYALGPAGPGAAKAAKAEILSSAAFARGMVIATGLAEAYAVGNGGGGGGGGIATTGGAVPVQPIDNPITPIDSGAQQSATVNVYIEGSAIGDDNVREVVVDAVKTAFENDELIEFR